ncbi:MAG TPA: TonB-dependent receptor [Bacteroidales bacterium]|nr:TonB-dependent receptor [Bacteroidales bacterium]
MNKKLLLFAMWAILPWAAFSQFTLTGKITDKHSSEALPGANVRLENTFMASFSDADGNFTIKKLKKGIYTLKISFMGYQDYSQQVNLTQNTSLKIELVKSSILQEGIIISATRVNGKQPATVHNIEKLEIKQLNLGQDLPYMMENTPSVVTTSDAGMGIGYTGMRIRGTDMTRINVTVNGIPYNEAESQEVYWVDVPDISSSVDNMQIQRGVGTSTNGAAAFGASINIQTSKVNAEPYGEINSSCGSFNSFKNNVDFGSGLINKHWSFDGRLSKITSDGYIDHSASDLKSFFVSGTYVGNKSLIKLNIFSGKERTHLAWNGVPSDSLNTNRTYNSFTYPNETDNYQQDHYQLFYSREINPNLFLNAALHYTKGQGYYEQYKADGKFADFGLDTLFIGNDTISKTNLIHQKWMDNDFYGITYSLDYKLKKVTTTLGGAYSQYDGDHYGKVIWTELAYNTNNYHHWYDNNSHKKDFNSYVKINYQINPKLNLYGDLQYRYVHFKIDGLDDDGKNLAQKHSYNFINPKAGINYDINQQNNVYFSFGVAHREPNRDNFKDADPGKLPKPEILNDYELGYNYHSTSLSVGANLYYMDYTDQLVLTGKINDVGSAIMTNVSKSYRTGIEFSGSAKIQNWLTWQANFTLSQNKIKNFTEYVDDWDLGGQKENKLGNTDLLLSPDLIANNIFTFIPFKNLSLSYESKYVGKQYIDNTSSNDRKLDPYFVNNIRLHYAIATRLIKEIGFNLMVNNLFSEKYESNAWVYRYYYEDKYQKMDGYFPQAGINFLAGVNLRF